MHSMPSHMLSLPFRYLLEQNDTYYLLIWINKPTRMALWTNIAGLNFVIIFINSEMPRLMVNMIEIKITKNFYNILHRASNSICKLKIIMPIKLIKSSNFK